MRLRLTLLLLCFALPAYADTYTATVNRDNGVTQTTEPLVLTPANLGAATAAQGARVDKTSADEVYATDYNGGVLNSTTISAAISAIGSASKTLVLSPGTWSMTAGFTVPANIRLKVQPGAIVSRTSGTLTINGPLDAPPMKWLTGFINWKLAFGPAVRDVYMDWTDAVGDGTTDDSTPFVTLLNSGPSHTVHLNGSKKYLIGTTCQTIYDGVVLMGHGATVVSNMEGDAVVIGGWKSSTSGQSIVFTKDSRTFTIPAGVTVTVGDMIEAWNSTPYNTSGSNYDWGVLTEVTAISGSTATISIPSQNTFTADNIGVLYPMRGAEIHDLILDNTASTSATRALVLTAKDFLIDNVAAKGSLYASAGLVVEGIRGKVSRTSSRGYIGQAASCLGGGGGRPCGYAITLNGHNITVDGDSTFADSKHTLSMCKGQYWTSNLTIVNSHLSQDPILFGTDGAGSSGNLYQMALDMHANCSEISVVGSTILAAGQNAAVGVRNGGSGVKFYGNTIRYLNNVTTPNSIFGVGDTDLSVLKLTDNTISALAANTPLVAVYDGAHAAPLSAVQTSNNSYTNVTPTPLNTAIDDTAYDATSWDGDITHAPSKNAVRDKIEALVAATGNLTLKTNGTNNASQTVLNLKAGTNMTLTPDGAGGVTFDATSGSTGAPSAATYIVQTATNQPTNAQVLASLASGLLYNTTATGVLSVKTIGTGANNIVALDSNSKLPAVDGSALTLIGVGATDSNTNIGKFSLTSPTGTGNTAYGRSAMAATSSASNNTAIGRSALAAATTGGNNTANGYFAGSAITSGSDNVAIGYNALLTNLTGYYNVAVGSGTLPSFNPSDTRGNNTAIGYGAGAGITGSSASSNNTFLGAASASSGNVNNATAVGYGATVTASNQMVFGNSSVTANLFNGSVTAKSFVETVKANGTCSTSINIDPTLGGIHTLTLSGACAIGVTNLAAGQSFALKLTQSSTAAPTFTSAYKWPGASQPTWSTSATKYDVLSCYSDDGTTLLCNGMVDVR